MEAGGKVNIPVGASSGDVGVSFGVAVSADVSSAGPAVKDATATAANGNAAKTADAEEIDADGYRVEKRHETEQHLRTKEIRELDDHQTEIRQRDENEVRLEEVKVKESAPRLATVEEMKALLEAEFDNIGNPSGGDDDEIEVELETSREVTVEEFVKVEKEHSTVEATTGDKKTETTVSESRTVEETVEKPDWLTTPQSPSPPPSPAAAAEIPVEVLGEPVDEDQIEPVAASGEEMFVARVAVAARPVAMITAGTKGKRPAEKSKPKPPPPQPPPAADDEPKVATDLYGYLTSPAIVEPTVSASVSAQPAVELSGKGKAKGGGNLFGKLKRNKKNKKGAPPAAAAATVTAAAATPTPSADAVISVDSSPIAASNEDDGLSSPTSDALDKKQGMEIDVEIPPVAADIGLSATIPDTTVPSSDDSPRHHHEIKHKRHVIEEVTIEDTHTFYESGDWKKPKLVAVKGGVEVKKKPGKENKEPTVERRKSAGEIPASPTTESLPIPPKTVSTSNVSSEQQVTYVVEHSLPVGKASDSDRGKKLSKDRWSWSLPTFKGSSGVKGHDSSAAPAEENEPPVTEKDKKGKTRMGKQEEVVVEDTGLFTDMSGGGDRKSWSLWKGPKHSIPAATAEEPEKGVEPLSTETVTFVVQPDPAVVEAVSRPDVPDAELVIEGGGEVKANAKGKMELPKFKLFDKKRGKSSSVEKGPVEKGASETAVEAADVSDSEPGSAGNGHHGRKGFDLPTFKIPDLHWGSKGKDKKEAEQVKLHEEEPILADEDDEIENGGDQKLKPEFHFGAKVHGGDDVPTSETVTFVVEHPEPTELDQQPRGTVATGKGGIDFPKIKLPDFHFGGKSSNAKEFGNDDTTETVTFVVENPVYDFETNGGSGHGDINVDLPTEPGNSDEGKDVDLEHEDGKKSPRKFHLPDFRFGLKGRSNGKPGTTENVPDVVDASPASDEKPSADVETKGGSEFPKLKLGLERSSGDDSKPKAEASETVIYVVEHPESPDADVSAGGSAGVKLEMPKLKQLFGGKKDNSADVEEGKKATADADDQNGEKAAADGGEEANRKWHVGLPDFHFGATRKQTEANVDTGETTVTYVVEQPDISVESPDPEKQKKAGFELPKLHVGKKQKADVDIGVSAVVNGDHEVEGSAKTKGKQKKKGKEAADQGDSNKKRGKKWSPAIRIGKKPSSSSSESADHDDSAPKSKPEEKTPKKWMPKFRFGSGSKGSYDVSVEPTDRAKPAVEAKLPTVDVNVSNEDDVIVSQPETGEVEARVQIPDIPTETTATLVGSVSLQSEVKSSKKHRQEEVIVDSKIHIPEKQADLSLSKRLSGLLHAADSPRDTDVAKPISVSANASFDVSNSIPVSVEINAGNSVETTISPDVVPELHQPPPAVSRSVNGDLETTFVFASDDDRVRVASVRTSTPTRTDEKAPRPQNLDVTGFDSSAETADKVQAGSKLSPWQTPPMIIVAVDFGTTFSGYAFCFPGDVSAATERGEPLPSIHVMRKWEGGDPGVVDMKTPTTLLLTPDREFHSFGFTARDTYHDLSPNEARRWLYFEKFKMALHYNAELNEDTELEAVNGQRVKASVVFSFALRFFRDHALQELNDQSKTRILPEDIKWIITVPAIWKEPAKQFMRRAAYEAGMVSADNPSQLLIALEPEAASIFVRRQRLNLLMGREEERELASRRPVTPDAVVIEHSVLPSPQNESMDSQQNRTLLTSFQYHRAASPIVSPSCPDIEMAGTKYMIVDCGGGTVDITVYAMITESGQLRELHQATGGPFGSTGIDKEFENLLADIFGADFIEAFKRKRPAGWVDLLLAFESRKRAATPFKSKPLNVSLPFSFTDYHKKHRNCPVETAVRKYNSKDVTWSQQGMLRFTPDAIHRLFQPTVDRILDQIANVLNEEAVKGLRFIFLVGGFAESPMLQLAVRNRFAGIAKILIPNDASLTILKGAVCYGLHPGVVATRVSRTTYGVAVVNRFQRGRDPESKLVVRDGNEWCVDVFDVLVRAGDSVGLDDPVVRSYAPIGHGQRVSIITVYASDNPDVRFVTDSGVHKCGTLKLELSETSSATSAPSQDAAGGESSVTAVRPPPPREIRAKMIFGDTEIKVVAVEVATGKSVRANFDFLSGNRKHNSKV